MQKRQSPMKEKSPNVYLKKLDGSPSTMRKYPTCNRKPCIGCEDMERCEGYVLTSGKHVSNHNEFQENYNTYRGSGVNHHVPNDHSSLDINYRHTPPPPPPRDPRTHMDHVLARKLVGSPV